MKTRNLPYLYTHSLGYSSVLISGKVDFAAFTKYSFNASAAGAPESLLAYIFKLYYSSFPRGANTELKRFQIDFNVLIPFRTLTPFAPGPPAIIIGGKGVMLTLVRNETCIYKTATVLHDTL